MKNRSLPKPFFLSYSKNRGFSLIELMISMALGILLLLSLTQILFHNKLSTQREIAESQLEEQLQYAKFILANHIRMAGFAGCNRADHLQIKNETVLSYELLRGYLAENKPDFLPGKALIANSDIIRMSQANNSNIDYLPHKITPDGLVPVTFQPNAFFISDCTHADLFEPEKKSGHFMGHAKPFQKTYLPGSQVAPWEDLTYYIALSSHQDGTGRRIPALYVKNREKNAEEIVDNIESMRIRYAKKVDDSDFVSAEKVLDWSHIKIVQITLIGQLQAAGETIRKEETFFVTLRNRLE